MNSRRYLTVTLFSLAPLEALAYLDPVTGSFIVQGIVAVFGVILVFWNKVKRIMVRLFRPKKNNPSASDLLRKDD